MDAHPSKEVLAAHALGALPEHDGERASVEAHTDACPDCQAQLVEFRLAAAELIDGGPPVDLDLAALDRTWAEVKRRLDRR
jgi:anti-sigma factor ChrR (cupin superfamily)